jgi:hypothetical protein
MVRTEGALCEMIGALLLIGVFIGVFAIVSFILLSQPLPEQVPASEFRLTVDTSNVNSYTITIVHTRGDSFRVLDTCGTNRNAYVKVNGKEWPVEAPPCSDNYTFVLIKNSASNADSFSAGDELVGTYPGSKPNLVQFFYKAPAGSEYLLWERRNKVL